MTDLLIQAMDAKQSGNIVLAKQLLAQALLQDPRNEGAWMLMSEIVDDAKLRRNCLQRVLMINPQNSAASLALMKLDTSPLGPVLRGERYKSVIPQKSDKTPPFTPPFTWTGEDSQFQALGDMTYPDQTGEQTNAPPETPETFDWAAESNEPDKTINKIFDAVSSPELAAQPPAESDLSWADQTTSPEEAEVPNILEQPAEAMPAEEPLEVAPAEEPTEIAEPELTEVEPALVSEPQPVNIEDFRVSAEPEWGSKAFSTTGEAIAEPAEPKPLLWHNSKARTDRLVILSSTALIYANPKPSDVPHILGMFNDQKMMRDLLGKKTGLIKLESIKRVFATPSRANLDIQYKLKRRSVIHPLEFKSTPVRDDAFGALQLRLGSSFEKKTESYGFMRKYGDPLTVILLVAILGWLGIAGFAIMLGLPIFQSYNAQLILLNLKYYTDLVGPTYLLLISVVIIALCLIWMLSNVSKPSRQVILQRKPKSRNQRTGKKEK